jgi:hypothetical protein
VPDGRRRGRARRAPSPEESASGGVGKHTMHRLVVEFMSDVVSSGGELTRGRPQGPSRNSIEVSRKLLRHALVETVIQTEGPATLMAESPRVNSTVIR